MIFLYKLLWLFSIIAILNFIGLHPQFEEPMEWIKKQHVAVQTLMYSYVAICTIGWLNIIGSFLYWYFS